MTATAQSMARPRADSTLAVAIKEAVIAGAMTLVLTSLLVGFHTIDFGGALGLESRIPAVAWAVGFVALGRFGLSLQRSGKPLPALIGGSGVGVILLLAVMGG